MDTELKIGCRNADYMTFDEDKITIHFLDGSKWVFTKDLKVDDFYYSNGEKS